MPGFREVRAPLAGGYIWVFLGWLLIAPSTPDPAGHGPYSRIDDLAHSVGPFGIAVGVSVLAYLVGSLVLTVIRRLLDFWREEGIFNEMIESQVGDTMPAEGWLRLDALAHLAGLTPGSAGYPETGRDLNLLNAMGELSARELGKEWRNLESAIKTAEAAKGESTFRLEDGAGPSRVAVLQIPREENSEFFVHREFTIPRFFPSKDLSNDLPLIRTRLGELAPVTSAKIERLFSESEFRFAVAVPLVPLLIYLAFTDWWWLSALTFPIALLFQGIALERDGNLEVVDALRARSESVDLEKITPVFKRYREQSNLLSAGLRDASFLRAEPPTVETPPASYRRTLE